MDNLKWVEWDDGKEWKKFEESCGIGKWLYERIVCWILKIIEIIDF